MGDKLSAQYERWQLAGTAITWNVEQDIQLPHSDRLEMSGRRISVIVEYAISKRRGLALQRKVYWPTLRGRKEDFRGYLLRDFGSAFDPVIVVAGTELRLGGLSVRRIWFDGVFRVDYLAAEGLEISRTICPSPLAPSAAEVWELRNSGEQPIDVRVAKGAYRGASAGMYGEYDIRAECPEQSAELAPGAALKAEVLFVAERRDRDFPIVVGDEVLGARRRLCAQLQDSLRLETPDDHLNRAFALACLRTAESIFETKVGLMHSPGGEAFYAGVWTNDQCEYAGPFFPFLGYPPALEAMCNTYRLFADQMCPDFARHLYSSLEVEGDVLMDCGDRGDAAMIASGASRFALALGDRAAAEVLFPAVAWGLEYCRRKTNSAGVVESERDELEGRFPSGTANLCTSCLAFDGLRFGARLARALGKLDFAEGYDARAEHLAKSIETYFGAEVEGYRTYRYFEGCEVLRSWICLPLVVGLLGRVDGTIQALFSDKLWSSDGLYTSSDRPVYWDRSTLYALRGVFAAGRTEKALSHLVAYTRRRLLGEHVPYAVECSPGGQHLAAESALYARVFIEGMFGVAPVGLDAFECAPRLPAEWDSMALRGLRAFGRRFDLLIERGTSSTLKLSAAVADGPTLEQKLRCGETVVLQFS